MENTVSLLRRAQLGSVILMLSPVVAAFICRNGKGRPILMITWLEAYACIHGNTDVTYCYQQANQSPTGLSYWEPIGKWTKAVER